MPMDRALEVDICDRSLALPVSDVVAEAWERILGVPASRGNRLLELLNGGDGATYSRQLGRLLSAIGDATGVYLPLTVIFTSPTPADLTKIVRDRVWPEYRRPIQMRPGVGQPLYVLPGLGSMGLDLVALMRDLRIPGPVYLNPPRGVDGAEPCRTIDAIVADHISVIKGVQPQGPYQLIGYSWGGIVALEIARALRASGETVGFLGMIEPVLGQIDWTYSAWIRYAVKRLQHHVDELRKITSPHAAIRYAGKRLAPLIRLAGRIFGVNQFAPLAEEALQQPKPLDVAWTAEVAAIDAYRNRVYPGPATIFASASGHAGVCYPNLIWPSKLASLDLHWIAGDHASILTEPEVQKLARSIEAIIASHTL